MKDVHEMRRLRAQTTMLLQSVDLEEGSPVANLFDYLPQRVRGMEGFQVADNFELALY